MSPLSLLELVRLVSLQPLKIPVILSVVTVRFLFLLTALSNSDRGYSEYDE